MTKREDGLPVVPERNCRVRTNNRQCRLLGDRFWMIESGDRASPDAVLVDRAAGAPMSEL